MSSKHWMDPKPSDPWTTPYYCPIYLSEPCFLVTRCDSVEEFQNPGSWVGRSEPGSMTHLDGSPYRYEARMLIRCPYRLCHGIVNAPYEKNYLISVYCPGCSRHLYLYTEDDFKVLAEDEPFARIPQGENHVQTGVAESHGEEVVDC